MHKIEKKNKLPFQARNKVRDWLTPGCTYTLSCVSKAVFKFSLWTFFCVPKNQYDPLNAHNLFVLSYCSGCINALVVAPGQALAPDSGDAAGKAAPAPPAPGGKAQPRRKFQPGTGTNRATADGAAASSLTRHPGQSDRPPPPRTSPGLAAGRREAAARGRAGPGQRRAAGAQEQQLPRKNLREPCESG